MIEKQVRADILQRFTARERMQARLNIRAAKMPDPVQAFVHGLDLVISSSSSSIPPALGGDFDDGGNVLVSKTPLGNWSSDGNDTAPITGHWLFISRDEVTETVDVPPDEDDPDGFLSESVTTVRWVMELWEDGTQDTAFAWESETLPLADAEDLFAFRTWTPIPNEEDPYWDEDAVETDSTVWIEPIEPPPVVPAIGDISGLQAALDARIEFVAMTTITDASMTALGFTDQIEALTSSGTVFIPVSYGSPWS